jgi:signal transduction histidine kinase
LTQRLLAFARRQPLAPKPIDANALVGGMSELLHRTLGETIAIETVLAAGLWRAEADANELESAILNLAVNARDAMPEGGRLTLETSNAYIDEAYVAGHPELTQGQYVLLSVSDSGTGMDPQTVQQAFEPFFTTKPVGAGTGLGLAIAYSVVQAHSGSLSVETAEGGGACFVIGIPRQAA